MDKEIILNDVLDETIEILKDNMIMAAQIVKLLSPRTSSTQFIMRTGRDYELQSNTEDILSVLELTLQGLQYEQQKNFSKLTAHDKELITQYLEKL